MAGNILELNDSNFQHEVLESVEPVLVDFWAPWCGPCRMLAPTIEELANEYAGKVKVAKLNTEDAQDTAMKYGIQSIPTVVFFKNGAEANRIVGLRPKNEFKQILDA